MLTVTVTIDNLVTELVGHFESLYEAVKEIFEIEPEGMVVATEDDDGIMTLDFVENEYPRTYRIF